MRKLNKVNTANNNTVEAYKVCVCICGCGCSKAKNNSSSIKTTAKNRATKGAKNK